MYYYLLIVVITLLPTGSPLTVRSMTGPFITLETCLEYENNINIVMTSSSQPVEIFSSECREEDKGKII